MQFHPHPPKISQHSDYSDTLELWTRVLTRKLYYDFFVILTCRDNHSSTLSPDTNINHRIA